jgi:hypothetical protein
MTQRVYIVRPAVVAPVVLAAIAIVVAVRESLWALAALPFIYLGSISAQPNLNLANGCLAYLAMVAGFLVLALFRPLGFAILNEARHRSNWRTMRFWSRGWACEARIEMVILSRDASAAQIAPERGAGRIKNSTPFLGRASVWGHGQGPFPKRGCRDSAENQTQPQATP